MRLSIIVPTRNESETLPSLLKQLQTLRSAGHEVLVIDGGSLDGTLDYTAGIVDHATTVEAGRAYQLNEGAKRAHGDVFWFLHADSLVPDGAVQAIQQAFQEPDCHWGWFDVSLSGKSISFRVIEWAMNCRARWSGIATGDQGLFVSRSAFEGIGGFPEIALMEDIELSKALKAKYQPRPLALKLTTSSRRWEQRGVFRTVLLMWLLRAAHFLGCNPQLLSRIYRQRSMRRVPRLIQVFARTPVMGRVKSRLAQDTDRFQALHGHRRLLLNSVTTSAACRIPLQYWCADAASFYAESWMTPLRRRQRRRQQACGGLGTRMHEALDAGFKSARSVVLIGSDCPELSVAYLHAAFRALEQVPVVIGPARDGGYVLIGINGLSVLKRRSLFRGIEWGSDQVMSQTLARLRRVGTSWACLPPLDDLDNVEALRRHAGVLQARPRVRWS